MRGLCRGTRVGATLRKVASNGRPANVSLRQSLAPVIDFVFPPRCPGCGDAVLADPHGDDALCGACFAKLELPGEPSCAACQRPFGADHFAAEALCAKCLAEPPLHDGIVAATIYGEISRQMVLDLKHAGRIALAGPMGRRIAARIGERGGTDPLIVPVPLHRWRIWKRGYNQSALIAGSIARSRGWALAPDALIRRRATRSLGGLSPDQRKAEVRGAIAISPKWAGRIRGRAVVLVDDVLTSGATSEACVRALKAAGATRVVIACYARVVAGDPVVRIADEISEVEAAEA